MTYEERIRKTLIKFHKSTIDIDGIKGGDIIDWLEKQGEQKSILDELEMTLSVSEEGYLRSNIEKLIREFKNNTGEKTELIEMLEVDGFDAELNALLKKYEYLPNDEMVECLKFYTAELINNKKRMEQ